MWRRTTRTILVPWNVASTVNRRRKISSKIAIMDVNHLTSFSPSSCCRVDTKLGPYTNSNNTYGSYRQSALYIELDARHWNF